MAPPRPSADRKEQIISAAIDRLFAVGFEGFRIGDVARDVGINNATLIHHFPSKVALIRAVVERFTQRFEAVTDNGKTGGSPRTKLIRHMQSSVTLMQSAPEMFVVLNEIMIRARRDAEIAGLVSVPVRAWRDHIISLILTPKDARNPAARTRAGETATACMAQLLGMGLLLTANKHADFSLARTRDRSATRAIAALSSLVKDSG